MKITRSQLRHLIRESFDDSFQRRPFDPNFAPSMGKHAELGLVNVLTNSGLFDKDSVKRIGGGAQPDVVASINNNQIIFEVGSGPNKTLNLGKLGSTRASATVLKRQAALIAGLERQEKTERGYIRLSTEDPVERQKQTAQISKYGVRLSAQTMVDIWKSTNYDYLVMGSQWGEPHQNSFQIVALKEPTVGSLYNVPVLKADLMSSYPNDHVSSRKGNLLLKYKSIDWDSLPLLNDILASNKIIYTTNKS